jgi:hypothetical protein
MCDVTSCSGRLKFGYLQRRPAVNGTTKFLDSLASLDLEIFKAIMSWEAAVKSRKQEKHYSQ